MRYNEPIYFVDEAAEYDYETGNNKTVQTKTLAYAHVSAQTKSQVQLAYGGLKQGALTVRIQNKHTAPFKHIEYAGRKYTVTDSKTFRREQVFHVVNSGGVS